MIIKRWLFALLVLWFPISAILLFRGYFIAPSEPVAFSIGTFQGAFSVPNQRTETMTVEALVSPDYSSLLNNKFVFNLHGTTGKEEERIFIWPTEGKGPYQAATKIWVIDADGDGLDEVLCLDLNETRMLSVSNGKIVYREPLDRTPASSRVITVCTAQRDKTMLFLVAQLLNNANERIMVYTWTRGAGFRVHMEEDKLKEVLESFTQRFY